MKINWIGVALKLPSLIQGAVSIVEHVKNAKGSEKKQAVVDSIPGAIELVEFGVGRDLLNDPAIMQLVSAVIDAEAAALKARNALKDGLLAKTGPSPTS